MFGSAIRPSALGTQRFETRLADATHRRDVLSGHRSTVLDFTEEPEADEWHQSENARPRRGYSAASLDDPS